VSEANGKVAVVTGAASGIGRSLAQRFDREGYSVAIVDVNEIGLHETAKLLSRPALVDVVDVSKRDRVEAFAARVLAEHGHVDVVVNNAGVTVMDSLVDVSYEDFEWLFGINFWGVVYGTKAFLPSMIARGTGTVVNISSIFGIVAWTHQGPYNAAKFAVRGFTEALWQELEGTGVRAMTVHPGGIKTNIARNGRFRRTENRALTHETMSSEFDRVARTTPNKAASVIYRGIVAGERRVLVGVDAKVLALLQRVLPVGYASVLKRLESRAR
jgi:NAD(P)-dependent dehydrogenase (short-subunit alcohol dehydrogenase family)